MKTKAEYNKEIKELKTKLVGLCNDAHFAKTLIDEMLSLKGQSCIEPLELNVGKRVDSLKGETFEIVKTDRGCLYHEYGGYSIFVNPEQKCLYETLVDYVDNKEAHASLEGEEKEMFELNLSAVAHCISLPKYVFVDVEFTYEIATKVIEFLKKTFEEAMDADLQDETIDEDEQFKQATLGLENLKEEIKNVENEQ